MTNHSRQNMKTMYKSNVFTPPPSQHIHPRTLPLSMLRRNVWANNIFYLPATLFRVGGEGDGLLLCPTVLYISYCVTSVQNTFVTDCGFFHCLKNSQFYVSGESLSSEGWGFAGIVDFWILSISGSERTYAFCTLNMLRRVFHVSTLIPS